jgi:Tfp pilus assembly protein PilW
MKWGFEVNDLASRQRGLSLVELLVGLAAGIIFSLSVIVVQLALSRQNMQMSDVGQRDGEVRAALDLLTEDLSTSGFLLGGVQPECGAVFAYDSNLPTAGAFQQYPISATAQTSTTSLPTSSTQPTITAGSYVSAISSATTSMLSIYVAQTGLAASTTSAPAIYNVQQSVVLNSGGTNIGTSTSSGAVSTSVLPLQSTTGISAGSVGYLRLFFPGNNIVCFRAPATTVSSGVSITSSGGSSGLFPSTGYAGFNAALRSASVLAAGASLTNNNFVYGRFY